MADKDPFNYKRTKERNLPFTKASRCLLEHEGVFKILNTKGFTFDGTNDLSYGVEKTEEEGTGYLDSETVICILLREVCNLQIKVTELENKLKG